MPSAPYDAGFTPPAPTLLIRLGTAIGPADTEAMALVDSGADVTVLPADLVAQLGLRRVGLVRIAGLSRRTTTTSEYSAKVGIPGLGEHIIRTITWGERYALLGRDVLNRWRIILDGPSQTLYIS